MDRRIIALKARSTEISIIYEGKNITQDIAPYLLSFTFNDNSTDKADDISIQIEDREGLWLNDWAPSKSDKITCSVILHDENDTSLPCGTFQVDQIEYSYPPGVLSIKAVSTAITSGMRNEKHNRAWENVKLKTIAQDIASQNGLSLFYDAKEFMIERREQIQKSDLEFITSLSKDYGLGVKVRDGQLIIYDEKEYEEKPESAELLKSDRKILSCKFTSKSSEVYRKAHVKYHHPVRNETYESESEDEDEEGSERVLEIREYAESTSQAQETAERRLYEANKKEITGSINLMGDIRFSAGQNILLGGFGMFSGKYTITKATHKIDSSGYTTSLEIGETKASKKSTKTHKTKRTGKSKKNASTKELFYEGTEYYGYKP